MKLCAKEAEMPLSLIYCAGAEVSPDLLKTPGNQGRQIFIQSEEFDVFLRIPGKIRFKVQQAGKRLFRFVSAA